jgi:hypothetical protein
MTQPRFSNFSTIMDSITVPMLKQITDNQGKLMKLLQGTSMKEAYISESAKIPHQTKGQWKGGYRPIGGELPNPGDVGFVRSTWVPSTFYNSCEFERLGDLFTSNKRSSVVDQSSFTITDMVTNSVRDISFDLWGNGASERAWLSATTNSYASGIWTLSAVGGYVQDVPHRSPLMFIKEGMYLDLIDETTHLPIAGGTGADGKGLYVESAGYDATGAAVTVTLSNLPAAISGIAAGDYFVKHGTLDSSGKSEAPFGMTALFASGNPTGSVSIPQRQIGGLDASAYAWHNPAYNGDAANTAANNLPYLLYAIKAVNENRNYVGGTANLAMCNVLTAYKIAAGLDGGANFVRTNTMVRDGGFQSVKLYLGERTNELIFDDETPINRVFIWDNKAIEYTVIQPLKVIDQANMASQGYDKTLVTVAQTHGVACYDRRGLAQVIDIG